jgi:hypothetical protein
MTFITAATMPLLIALAAIGQSDGVMLPANAAALVGAGVVSVLVFPAVATLLAAHGPARAQIRAAMNAASVPSVARESRLRSSAATSTP